MTKFDADNLSAPHTQRELGVEPAPEVDVSTEAVMRLVEAINYSTKDPETGDDLCPGAYVHLAVEDAVAASVAITALLADRDRLANEVARLTAGLSLWIDRAEAAEAEVARLRKVYWRLRSYATHDDGCKLNKAPRFSGPCSCGLADALKGGAA